MIVSFSEQYSETNIFLSLIKYQLNSLVGVLHLVDHHNQFIFDSTSKDIC